nr:hypothetical protein KPHV_86330 [Kitasatospora purpeofusca]
MHVEDVLRRQPSAGCPHRLCGLTHCSFIAALAVATVLGVLDLHGWGTRLLTFATAAVGVLLVLPFLLRRPGRRTVDGTRSTPVEIQRGWARAALSLDLLYLVCAVLLACRPNPSAGAPGPTRQGFVEAGVATVVTAVIMIVLLGLWKVVHRQATRPSRAAAMPAAQ